MWKEYDEESKAGPIPFWCRLSDDTSDQIDFKNIYLVPIRDNRPKFLAFIASDKQKRLKEVTVI